MPSLSFNAGKPDLCEAIAVVQGGDKGKSGRILYCHHSMTKEGRMMGTEKGDAEVKIPHDKMLRPIPSPNPDKRQIWYITGASGSGKSQMARMLAESQKRLFPERPVYLISKLKEDETLDNCEFGAPKRVKIESLIDNPIEDLKELNGDDGCLVIADDFDTLEKKEKGAVKQLLDDIASMGRHNKISLIYISHRITNYKDTRLMLGEATHQVVFPQSTPTHNLRQLLVNQGGLTPEQCRQLRRMGRWVIVSKEYPAQVMGIQEARDLLSWSDKPMADIPK